MKAVVWCFRPDNKYYFEDAIATVRHNRRRWRKVNSSEELSKRPKVWRWNLNIRPVVDTTRRKNSQRKIIVVDYLEKARDGFCVWSHWGGVRWEREIWGYRENGCAVSDNERFCVSVVKLGTHVALSNDIKFVFDIDKTWLIIF